MKLLSYSTIVSLVLLLAGPCAADDFYKGNTIRIVAGTAPGSPAGLHSRLIQQHLGKQIPGNPSVVVQHMPAGGGLAAANHTYNVAKRDGSEFGIINRNNLFFPLFGLANAQFKPDGFNWIGTPASYEDNAWVFIVSPKIQQNSLKEVVDAKVLLNVAGVGPENPFVAIIKNLFRVEMKFITGYNTTDMALAFERGEVDAFGSGYSTIATISPQLLEPGKQKIMVQFRRSGRLPVLAHVPNGRELAQSADDLALIELAETSLTLGFPMAGPPGMPPDRVAIVRTAFRKMVEDAEFKADAAKMKVEYSPMLGEELQSVLSRLAATPPDVIQRYKNLLGQPN